MTLHIFQSSGSPELFGFTVDAKGSNLPEASGRWKSVGDALPLGVAMASASPKISEEVERFGFALVEGHSETLPEVPRNETVP